MYKNNSHIPVMINEIIKFIPKTKKINVIDATFGGGGYSKHLLEYHKINNLIAIDRDPITSVFAINLKKKFKNFKLINGRFSQIDDLINYEKTNKINKFDIIIFDLGLSSNQLNNSNKGFSFMNNGPLDMNMGGSDIDLNTILNDFSEKKIADILYNFGNEKFAKKIAKNIVKFRKKHVLKNTNELTQLIKDSVPYIYKKKSKIDPSTKTFQALRIYVNDELNELKVALEKASKLLEVEGKIIVVSFHSLEDRIVKDFFNHKSGKRWRSSRHYPELADKGQITFKLITKRPIRPNEREINLNPRSRSAKLRIVQKIN